MYFSYINISDDVRHVLLFNIIFIKATNLQTSELLIHHCYMHHKLQMQASQCVSEVYT